MVYTCRNKPVSQYSHTYYNQDWYQNSPWIYPITDTPYEMIYKRKRQRGCSFIKDHRNFVYTPKYYN